MIVNANSTKKNWDYIDKTWSNFDAFSLTFTPAKELTNITAIHTIEELVQKLAQVPKVKNVRAIALRFPDIHWIDFELELQPEVELSHQEWENLQDLVIGYEWKLRADSGEKWYFHAEPVTSFSPLRDGSVVRNNSYNQLHQGIRKKISSSNITFNCELTTSKNSFTQK